MLGVQLLTPAQLTQGCSAIQEFKCFNSVLIVKLYHFR